MSELDFPLLRPDLELLDEPDGLLTRNLRILFETKDMQDLKTYLDGSKDEDYSELRKIMVKRVLW